MVSVSMTRNTVTLLMVVLMIFQKNVPTENVYLTLKNVLKQFVLMKMLLSFALMDLAILMSLNALIKWDVLLKHPSDVVQVNVLTPLKLNVVLQCALKKHPLNV